MDKHFILIAPGGKHTHSYHNMNSIGTVVKLVQMTGLEPDISGLQGFIDAADTGDYWQIGTQGVLIRVSVQDSFPHSG